MDAYLVPLSRDKAEQREDTLARDHTLALAGLMAIDIGPISQMVGV